MIVLGVFATSTVASAQAPAATGTTKVVHVKQSSLDQYSGCAGSSGAYFVINQITIPPDTIAVKLSDGSSAAATKVVDNNTTAHYQVDLTGDLSVTDATAEVPSEWSGQFVLSHCIAATESSSSTGSSTSESSTPTTETSTSSVPPTVTVRGTLSCDRVQWAFDATAPVREYVEFDGNIVADNVIVSYDSWVVPGGVHQYVVRITDIESGAVIFEQDSSTDETCEETSTPGTSSTSSSSAPTTSSVTKSTHKSTAAPSTTHHSTTKAPTDSVTLIPPTSGTAPLSSSHHSHSTTPPVVVPPVGPPSATAHTSQDGILGLAVLLLMVGVGLIVVSAWRRRRPSHR